MGTFKDFKGKKNQRKEDWLIAPLSGVGGGGGSFNEEDQVPRRNVARHRILSEMIDQRVAHTTEGLPSYLPSPPSDQYLSGVAVSDYRFLQSPRQSQALNSPTQESRVTEKRHDLRDLVQTLPLPSLAFDIVLACFISLVWIGLTIALGFLSQRYLPLPSADSTAAKDMEYSQANRNHVFYVPSSFGWMGVVIVLIVTVAELLTRWTLVKSVHAELFTRLVVQGCSTADLRAVDSQVSLWSRLKMLRISSVKGAGPLIALEVLANIGSVLAAASLITAIFTATTITLANQCSADVSEFPVIDLSQNDSIPMSLTAKDQGKKISFIHSTWMADTIWRKFMGCQPKFGGPEYKCIQFAMGNGFSVQFDIQDWLNDFRHVGPPNTTLATAEVFCTFSHGPAPDNYQLIPGAQRGNYTYGGFSVYTHVDQNEIEFFITPVGASLNFSCSGYFYTTPSQNVIASLSRYVVIDEGQPVGDTVMRPHLGQAVISQSFSLGMMYPETRNMLGWYTFQAYNDPSFIEGYLMTGLMLGCILRVSDMDLPQVTGVTTYSCVREVVLKFSRAGVWLLVARTVCVVLVALIPLAASKLAKQSKAPIKRRQMAISELLPWLDIKGRWADGCNIGMSQFSPKFYLSDWAVRERSEGHLTFMNDLDGDACTDKGYAGSSW